MNRDLEAQVPSGVNSRISSIGTPSGTTSSSKTFDIESWCYIRHENYELQVVKKTAAEERKVLERIPSTYQERLAFYRCYVTFSHNTHHTSMQFLDFNRYLWQFIVNTIMKSLPMSYIYLFLASYVPNEPWFVSKMVPIFYGHNFAVVSSAMINLFTLSSMIARYIDFMEYSIRFGNPWSRCIAKLNISGRVCTLKEQFHQYHYEGKLEMKYNYTYSVNGRELTLPAVMFYRYRLNAMDHQLSTQHNILLYVWCVWFLALLCHRQIFKRYIWRIFNVCQWSVNTIFFGIIIHMIWVRMEIKMPKVLLPRSKLAHRLLIAFRSLDIGFIAESMTAPVVLHILSSRGKQEINPGVDSGVMVLSNTVYYLGKGFLLTEMSNYLESLLGFDIVGSMAQAYPYFLFFPLYFSNFAFASYYIFTFNVSMVIMEITMFIIIFQCLIETMIMEWPKMNAFLLSLVLCFVGSLQALYLNARKQAVLNLFSMGITTLCETLIVIFFYPLGRLQDDIYFHTGKTVTSIVSMCFKLMPFYYMIKLYFTINGCIEYLDTRIFLNIMHGGVNTDIQTHRWIWSIYFVPYGVGIIFAVAFLIKKKQTWKCLFRPVPSWGPSDRIERELRKQFDSRDFSESTSARYLSRHVKAKTESYMYKLDVCYDDSGTHLQSTAGVRRETITYANEKKTE